MLDLLLALQDHGADAAGHAAEQPPVMAPANWLPGVTALVVFGVAFFILARAVWPKITQALDERDAKIRDEIRSAEEAREQAKAALAEYEAELAKAREEASRMIQQARSEAKATAEQLRAQNEQEINDMRARAQREIQSAKESAIGELHAEAANLAASIASKILQREITVEDQQRLVDESLSQLSGVSAN